MSLETVEDPLTLEISRGSFKSPEHQNADYKDTLKRNITSK